MEFTPYTLPLIVAAAIALGLSFFVLRHRDVPGRVSFSLLMLAVFVWSAGYALEISALDEQTKLFWAKMQYFGIAAIPLLWLRFVIHYVGESAWMNAARFALLSIGPVLTLFFVWFTDLIWANYTMNSSLGFPMLVFEYGPGLWAYAGYSYLLLLIGALVLFRAIVRLPRLGSRQGAVVLFAALAPWAGNAMYLTGTNPFPLLDLTPFSFTLTGLAVAWGMGRFQFMGTVPVAHRAIIGGMQAGVVALDTADNIVELNPAAERMFGLRSDDVVGRAAGRVFADDPDLIEWLTAPREATIRGSLESGGVEREFDIRTMLLYDRRRHAGRLITFHDISKLAKAERQAAEAQEVAEAANRSKSEFLANVSHEIRTPLNAIMGMTDLTLEGRLSVKQREYLQIARSSADSLLSIINDILDFSKIEVRKLELDVVAFDLRDLVEDTIKMLAVTASGKSLRLKGKVAEDVPRVVIGDALRLRQVLINLVSNAIKFTSEGDVSVAVSLGDRTGVDDERCRLLLAVTDTGIGISAEDVKLIFESFAQADASTTRIYGGTGLGLSIASHLVDLMEGEIDVESEVGEGSAFTFSIVVGMSAAQSVEAEEVSEAGLGQAEVVIDFGEPVAAEAPDAGAVEEAVAAPEDTTALPDLAPLQVLVADDNIINQRMTSALLESRGHTAKVVGDGQEAIEALGDATFDIILMDVQMPNLDGVEATRSIRAGEQWTGRHVPIIAITAHAMKGDRERFLEAGMDAYVPKPVDNELLFRTMALLLNSNDSSELESLDQAASIEAPEPSAPQAVGPPASETANAAPVEAVAVEGPVINRDVALQKLGGDEELLVEIIDLYLDDSPRVLDTLRAAVEGQDAEGIWKSAHRLKGSVGSLSGERAFAAARNLEQLGREGKLDGTSEALAHLEREAEALAEALSNLRAEVVG